MVAIALLFVPPGSVFYPGNSTNAGLNGNAVYHQFISSMNINISSDMTLTSNLTGGDITIESGVTVMTDGWNIFSSGTFTNFGTILTGTTPSGNYKNSYGGSGAGAQSQAESAGSSSGFSTLAPGGPGSSSNSVSGGNGSTPLFTINASSRNVLFAMYNDNFSNTLPGAGAQELPGLSYSGGAYGIAICAVNIYPGRIIASGSNGSGTGSGIGLIGGGGGGAILLSYNGTLHMQHECNVSGGHGVPGAGGGIYSGNGGYGQIITYNKFSGNITDKVPAGQKVLNPTTPINNRIYRGTASPGVSGNEIFLMSISAVSLALVPAYYWKKNNEE